jgi:hypothetical protein
MTDKSAQARNRLVSALREAGASQELIDKADSGYYGDFTSPLATPIAQLVIDANDAGLRGIAARARDGEFDG